MFNAEIRVNHTRKSEYEGALPSLLYDSDE